MQLNDEDIEFIKNLNKGMDTQSTRCTAPQLNDEDMEFIKNLSKEMNTQDTRCTAQPYGLLIKQEVTRVVPDGVGDRIVCYWEEGEYTDWGEFINDLKEYYDYDSHDFSNSNKLKDELKHIFTMGSFNDLHNTSEATSIGANVFFTTKGQEFVSCGINFFLTEKASKKYIEENSHNLNQPTDYGIKLSRNPEMERLVEIIHKLASSK